MQSLAGVVHCCTRGPPGLELGGTLPHQGPDGVCRGASTGTPGDPWQVTGMSLPPHYGLQGLSGVVLCRTQGPTGVRKGGSTAALGAHQDPQGEFQWRNLGPAGAHKGGGSAAALPACRGSWGGAHRCAWGPGRARSRVLLVRPQGRVRHHTLGLQGLSGGSTSTTRGLLRLTGGIHHSD